MDYGKILSRAWQITWRWKILWILGFLAGVGQGIGSSGPQYQMGAEQGGAGGFRIPDEMWAVFAVVGCLAILVGIALWVVSLIARGGLVTGVQQVEDEGATTLGAAWRAGVRRFWTLLGISILTGLPAFVAIVAGVIILGLLIVATVAAIDAAAEVGGFLGGTASVVCGGVVCCGGILLAIVLEQIRVYAERAVMLEGLGAIDSLKRGWQVLKDNLGPTIVLWLIFLVIGLVIGGVIAAPLFALMVPIFAVMGGPDPAAWLFIPICLGGLLWIIVSAVISSIVQTFGSATWTLAYRQFIGAGFPPAGPEVNLGDELLDLE